MVRLMYASRTLALIPVHALVDVPRGCMADNLSLSCERSAEFALYRGAAGGACYTWVFEVVQDAVGTPTGTKILCSKEVIARMLFTSSTPIQLRYKWGFLATF